MMRLLIGHVEAVANLLDARVRWRRVISNRLGYPNFFRALHAAAIISMLAFPAAAQTILSPLSLPFNERWTERVPVSGRPLVGVVSVEGTQPPSGLWVPSDMALPAALAGDAPVCVRATTQDGRYSAENSFVASGMLPDAGRVGLAWPTKHAADLKMVTLREIAAIARSTTCADSAEVIPVLLGSANTVGTLQVLVNTRGSALTAALRDPDTNRTLRRVACTRVEGAARVAFDARCVLGDVAGLPPRPRLRLEQVSRDGLQTEIVESVTLRLHP